MRIVNQNLFSPFSWNIEENISDVLEENIHKTHEICALNKNDLHLRVKKNVKNEILRKTKRSRRS